MDRCAKCGKELGFRDKHKGFHLILFLNALDAGLFSEYGGKKVCLSCQRELLDSKGIKYRGLLGQKQGMARIKELSGKAASMNKCAKCGKKLGWFERHSLWYQSYKMCNSCYFQYINQLENDSKNPEVKTCNKCGYFEEVRHERGGVDDLGTYFDESYSTFKCRKFNFDLDGMKYYLAQKCSSYISKEEYEEKCLTGRMEKEHVQIVLDFSSLKDVMAKGGIVMPTYNCPKCNAMIDIPEAGKIMFCKYCGTPIKPVDIFDRIKSLL
jgi:hypothetical protein